MWNDFLPGIVSVGISVCVFLYAWISDIRRIQRLDSQEPPQIEPLFDIESTCAEPLSMSTDGVRRV